MVKLRVNNVTTIDILMSHKSIRKFTKELFENEVLRAIVKAG